MDITPFTIEQLRLLRQAVEADYPPCSGLSPEEVNNITRKWLATVDALSATPKCANCGEGLMNYCSGCDRR